MVIDSKEIRFSCREEEQSVVFSFSALNMNAEEMFMQWVRFMNAIGYVLDPAEMEEMWNDR